MLKLFSSLRESGGDETGETGEEMDAYFFISPQIFGAIQVASTLRILLEL